jgi:hypothetical protein
MKTIEDIRKKMMAKARIFYANIDPSCAYKVDYVWELRKLRRKLFWVKGLRKKKKNLRRILTNDMKLNWPFGKQ